MSASDKTSQGNASKAIETPFAQKKYEFNQVKASALRNLVDLKPSNKELTKEAEKLVTLILDVAKPHQDKENPVKSELPSVEPEVKTSTDATFDNPIKKIFYQYILTNVDLEELTTYIKHLANNDLLNALEEILRQKHAEKYKRYIKAAGEFTMELEHKAGLQEGLLGAGENDDEDGKNIDPLLDFVENSIDPANILVGFMETAYEYALHHEAIYIIDEFAKAIGQHHDSSLYSDERTTSQNKISKSPDIKKLKLENQATAEKFDKILSIMIKKFHELPTHEDKTEFCKKCLDVRKQLSKNLARKGEQKHFNRQHSPSGIQV